MKRRDYLETRQGQAHEKLTRSRDKIYLHIEQEPKSKNGITVHEQREFRKIVKEYLTKYRRRPFRGDIILEIDFQTTADNPPALQTLTKNYLDLLHKRMPEVDRYQKILFKDDNQIKTLIANYHLDTLGNKKPSIRIRAYRYTHFIDDIELAERIMHDNFSSDSDFGPSFRRAREFGDDDETKTFSDAYYDDLRELEKDKEWYDEKMGSAYYVIQKHYLQRRIQEQFLQKNNISISDLIALFQSFLKSTKIYKSEKGFEVIWELTSNLISVTTNLIELGGAPAKKGDTKVFKANLDEKLRSFRSKYKLLFPLLHPISVTVFYTPPTSNLIDLDNLARYIIPVLTEVFDPPSSILLTYDSKYLNDSLKVEMQVAQRFPKSGISNYQMIHRPRTKDTPEEGVINFYITDGLFLNNNIWRTIDKFIDKWIE